MTTTQWILIAGALGAGYLLISKPAPVPPYATSSPLPPPAAPSLPPPGAVPPALASVLNGSGGWRGGAGQGSRNTLNSYAVTAAAASGIPGAAPAVKVATAIGPGLSVKLYNVESGIGSAAKGAVTGAGHVATNVFHDVVSFF